MMRRGLSARSLPLIFGLCLGAGQALGDSISLEISLNTAPLIDDPAGPFSLSFQLTDGSGLGDGNNTATLSGFTFGSGGGSSGGAELFGGASGDLSSQVTLVDSSFLNTFSEAFTPGATLSFLLNLTTNVDAGGTPDEFAFSILDSTGTELPTLGGSFFDVFVAIDIDSANPTVQTYAGDPSQTPLAGGPAIDTGSPVVTTTATPEPSVGLLAGLVLLWARKRTPISS